MLTLDHNIYKIKMKLYTLHNTSIINLSSFEACTRIVPNAYSGRYRISVRLSSRGGSFPVESRCNAMKEITEGGDLLMIP